MTRTRLARCPREDIFLLSYARDNTPLEGEIEVSADIAEKQLATIQRTICEIGAMRISRR